MQKLVAFFKDSYHEMMVKVTWPTLSEMQSNAVLVLVASIIFAVFIGVIDLAFKNAMDWFYNAF